MIQRRGKSVPRDIKQVERVRTKLAMVFQQFNLFPHLTVLDNITLGPRQVRNLPKAEAEQLGYYQPVGNGRRAIVDVLTLEGEEIHQVAVGPVHAGVIEPGP